MSEAAAAPVSAPSAPAPASESGGAPETAQKPAQAAGGASPKESKPAEKPAPRKLPEPVRLKTKHGEESIDDLDRLVHLASKGYGSDKTFEESKRLREEAAAEAKKVEAFKSGDPKKIRAALREMGVPVEAIRAMSEEELYEAIQAEQMTPEQKELAELKAWKAKQEEQAQKTKAEQEQAAQKEADEREYQRLEQLFAGALQKTGAPARSFPWLMQRMAKLEERNATSGIESTPEDLASEALNDVRAEQSAITKDMTGEDLISWLGEDAVKRINKAVVAKLRAAQNNPTAPRPVQQPTTNPAQTARKKFDWRTGQWTEEA